MSDFLRLHPDDNVEVALTEFSEIPFGHKRAVREIAEGEKIIKYGHPIGKASKKILCGEHVHTHNLETLLSETAEYVYKPEKKKLFEKFDGSFDGYLRSDGSAGTRNMIFIIPTVGCVNNSAQELCRRANENFAGRCDGFSALTHPYGCSQMGDDQTATQKCLAGLAKNPNVGGVLLLSLGCENNNLDAFLPYLGDGFDKSRLRTLVTQDCEDEFESGLLLLGELSSITAADRRVPLPLSKLTVGFKCGGSDAFSGITANPLCGRITDGLTAAGGKTILTEVPEMFGAEQLLMNRAADEKVFNSVVKMIEEFKGYYLSHNQVVYDNPSPGNKKGGITTLEEKSLGCVQKGGSAEVSDVLAYGEKCRKEGLSLLTGPGNDIVSCTNLAASGANLIVFTTGRGTPLGSVVPTVKIASNSALAAKKSGWIDFDAGKILSGTSIDTAAAELFALLLETASGRATKNEQNSCAEIAIFKNGVTL